MNRVQHDQAESPPYIPLTRREHEVLAHICDALSNDEIAEAMSISPRTVKQHQMNIYSKVGASNRTQLVVRALRWGLVVPSWFDGLGRSRTGEKKPLWQPLARQAEACTA